MRRKIVIVILFLSMTTLPYIFGWFASGSDTFFSGFLFNVADGNSYLAKMYQGKSGAWKFVLPYTANQGDGGYIFLFYMFIGQLARVLKLDLPLMFHFARVLSNMILAIVVVNLLSKHIVTEKRIQTLSILLALFGSGLGWLFVFFGKVTSDFWIAEMYPFLSAYANPHFPLAIALMLLTIHQYINISRDKKRNFLIIFLLSSLLSVILPFGCVILLLVIGISTIWEYLEEKKIRLDALLGLVIGSSPMMLYQVVLIKSDLILAGWHKQNITVTPEMWDLLVSLSPAFIMAMWGGVKIYKQKNHPWRRVLVAWLVMGIVLAYFPVDLQRRFLLGYYLPVVFLCGYALENHISKPFFNKKSKIIEIVILVVSLISNMIILVAGLGAISRKEPSIYLSKDQAEALAWIKSNTDQHDLIMAPAEMGLFIPSFTGRRVIYGHPYETIGAEESKEIVDGFYKNAFDLEDQVDILTHMEVDFVYYEVDREFEKRPLVLENKNKVFTSDGVSLYWVEDILP